MKKIENTALQMIAAASRCPDYGPDMVKSLMKKAGHERKGLCAFDECCPIHSASLDQRSCTALRHSKTPHADL